MVLGVTHLAHNQGLTGDDFLAGTGDKCPDRGRDWQCPYDNPNPGAIYSPGPGRLRKSRKIKYLCFGCHHVNHKKVLMFRWSRKSKLGHFANYNVSVVMRYDRDFGPGVSPGPGAKPGLGTYRLGLRNII